MVESLWELGEWWGAREGSGAREEDGWMDGRAVDLGRLEGLGALGTASTRSYKRGDGATMLSRRRLPGRELDYPFCMDGPAELPY